MYFDHDIARVQIEVADTVQISLGQAKVGDLVHDLEQVVVQLELTVNHPRLCARAEVLQREMFEWNDIWLLG